MIDRRTSLHHASSRRCTSVVRWVFAPIVSRRQSRNRCSTVFKRKVEIGDHWELIEKGGTQEWMNPTWKPNLSLWNVETSDWTKQTCPRLGKLMKGNTHVTCIPSQFKHPMGHTDRRVANLVGTQLKHGTNKNGRSSLAFPRLPHCLLVRYLAILPLTPASSQYNLVRTCGHCSRVTSHRLKNSVMNCLLITRVYDGPWHATLNAKKKMQRARRDKTRWVL